MRYPLLLAFLFLNSVSFASKTLAEEIIIGIEEARIDATQPGSNSSSAYMQIINFSETKTIELTSVNTDISNNVAIHQTPKEGLQIEAGAAAHLEPGGYHITLTQLKEPITVGSTIALTLHFAHGESYIVDAIVVIPGTHLHQDNAGQQVSHDNHSL
ncbi:MAG: copper(I)-binding protein [Kiritimatiellia bacterium]|jgi:copper(I)-binding protein